MGKCPTILVFDSGLGGLTVLRDVVRSESVTVLLVEHDVVFVSELCSRMVAFEFGELIAGAPCRRAANSFSGS